MMNASGGTIRVAMAAIVVAGAALVGGRVGAQAPLVDHMHFKDPPLQPPCSVDGVCRPKAKTFGYYSTRWRPWPGERSAAGAGEDAERSLPRIEDIDPKLEDREAPAPSEEVTGESDTPRTPDLPPLPPALGPRPEAPEGEGGDLPPLPRRPFAEPPGGEASLMRTPSVAMRLPPATPDVGSVPTVATASQPSQFRWARALDTPPPLPVALPEQSRVRWSTSSDAPPPLPGNLSGGPATPATSETVTSYPPPQEWGKAPIRIDSAVRRTGVEPSDSLTSRRAFFEPGSPPPFTIGRPLGR